MSAWDHTTADPNRAIISPSSLAAAMAVRRDSRRKVQMRGGGVKIVALAGMLATPAWPADARISFDKDVKPILEARCLKCHGAAMQLSKLDLRTRESALKGGEKGPSIVAHKPDESRLYRRVAAIEKPEMPMDGKLSEKEIAILRSWIAEGASWEGVVSGEAGDLAKLEEMTIPEEARRYWAFQKPVRAATPAIGDPQWNRHPVDRFVRPALDANGLEPAPEADRRTLLRRAFLDLTGLPPSPKETRQFLEDRAAGAWERLIDRLLESPHYGERWGRHWLDVARYADSNGYEHDYDRPTAWRYRDYVIRAFNEDKPFDRFLREQIAGDELDRANQDALIATGFLRNFAKVGFREKDNPQFRYDYLDDMIATIGRGLLGLTLQCARCHNHKFDPIAQKDYYRLQASLFGYVEVDHPLVPEAEARAWQAKTAQIEASLRPLADELREIERPYREKLRAEKFKKYPEHIRAAIDTPEEKRTPGQVLLANQIIRTTNVSSGEIERHLTPAEFARRKQIDSQMRELEKQRPAPVPVTMGITDGDYRFVPDGPGDEPAPGKGIKQEATDGSFLWDGSRPYRAPPSYFLHRGDTQSRGSPMRPGFPAVLTSGNEPVAMEPGDGRTSGRRRALAEWLVSPENPLTARVFVNRLWHHHFGRGIVATLDNFGKVGERPTHPELLDWLAVEFVEGGWSVKRMHRLLMTSRTYRMSSQFAAERNLQKDPENVYLWRFRAQRLEAEVVRDMILATSGALNLQMYGPAVFPPLPREVLASMKNGIWKTQADGEETRRRSVYVYRKRGLPFPLFEVFDLPDQNVTCGRRNVSTVATQALTLLHNDMVLAESRRLADRIATLAGDDAARRVELAWEIALARPPREEERRMAVEFLGDHTLADLAHVLVNLNEFIYLR